jgi:TetR/AcrR family transcriptional repressor of nem operon
MKVSRQQAAANHERIVEEAAKLFRERGFNGIGVADLMKSVGLTHGGFYGQFASKEDLMAQATESAVAKMNGAWSALADAGIANPLAAVANSYLSAAHRDAPGAGCLMAALGPEAARQSKPVRDAVTHALSGTFEALTRLAPGKTPAQKRKQAIATFAGMVGAMVLARAVNEPELSLEIRERVAEALPAAT